MENNLVVHQNEIEKLESITTLRNEKSLLWNSQAVNISIKDSIHAYLTTVDNEHTIRAKEIDLEQFSSFLNNNDIKSLGDLGKLIGQELVALIEAFLDFRMKDLARELTTVQRQKGSITKWLEYLNQQFPDLITVVPKLNSSRHKIVYSKGKTKALTLEQWFKLKEALENDMVPSKNDPNKFVLNRQWRKQARLRAICYTSLLLGGRRLGEVLNLKWKDIDFNSNTVDVKPLKSKEDSTVHTLPLNGQLHDILLEYRDSLSVKPEKDECVFPISPQSVDEALKRYAIRSGIGAISFHTLRTTFITWSIQKGDTMSEILNSTLHKSSQMIRYYDRTDKLRTSSILKMEEI